MIKVIDDFLGSYVLQAFDLPDRIIEPTPPAKAMNINLDL